MENKKIILKKKMDYWNNVPVGTKFKVVMDSNGHNYPMDTVLTVKVNPYFNKKDKYRNMANVTGAGCNNLDVRDCEFVVEETIESLELQIEELKKEAEVIRVKIDETLGKINFCKKNKLTSFDEDLVKVLKIMETFDSKASKMAKAKKIVELLQK